MPRILMPRCIDTLVDIGDKGCLATDDVHRLHFPTVTERRVRQKLAEWQQDGFIRSTKLVVSTIDDDSGSQKTQRIPTVHYLTERGGEAVADATGHFPRRIVRGDLSPHTLLHRLACVKTRLRFDAAAKALHLTTSWILEQDLRDDVPANTFPPNRRRVLHHQFERREGSCTCQPDMAALLYPTSGPPLPLMFEVDRATESHAQLRRKLPGYQSLLAKRGYRRYWPAVPLNHIRIVWVFPTPQRRSNVVASFTDDDVALAFRYGVFSYFEQTANGESFPADASLLTGPVWSDRRGNPISMLRV